MCVEIKIKCNVKNEKGELITVHFIFEMNVIERICFSEEMRNAM